MQRRRFVRMFNLSSQLHGFTINKDNENNYLNKEIILPFIPLNK